MEVVTPAELHEHHSKGLPRQETRTSLESLTQFSAFVDGVLLRWCKYRGDLPPPGTWLGSCRTDRNAVRSGQASPCHTGRGARQDRAGHSAPQPPLCVGAAAPQRSHPARPQASGVLWRILAFMVSPKCFLPHCVVCLSSLLAGCCPSLFLLSCVYTSEPEI